MIASIIIASLFGALVWGFFAGFVAGIVQEFTPCNENEAVLCGFFWPIAGVLLLSYGAVRMGLCLGRSFG